MMRVLITGATGLVGREITRHCLKLGIAVNYLTTNKAKIVSKTDYQGFYWKPENNEIDLRCFQGVDAIINLAGASVAKKWNSMYKQQILSSRTNTLQTLYKALQKVDAYNINTIVSASAIGVYPDSLSNYYDESESEKNKNFLGEVVQTWEHEADKFTDLDIKVAKIRIGIVLSKDGGALKEMARPIKNYVGAALGSGEQWQSWIHIEDLARMFLFILENELEGVFNGVAPDPITNTKLTKEIADVLGKPLILPNVPKFVLKTILGEMAAVVLGSQRVSSKKIEGEGFIFNFRNICLALNNLYTKQGQNCVNDSEYTKEYV
ncbi:TIGR01777 family oxidoreductase [Spongiimicrobium salis]|uniref:TIGR01777 family oxidoreductase n=1 Tax=Spongiimicrobium salis TaxID=1667022 RepID=UPI00374DA768